MAGFSRVGRSWGGHQDHLLECKQRGIAVGVKAHGASFPAFLRARAGAPPLWMQLWALGLALKPAPFQKDMLRSRRPVLSRDAWPGHPELLKEVRPAGSSLAHLNAPCYSWVLAITGSGGREKTQAELHTQHVRDIWGFPPHNKPRCQGRGLGSLHAHIQGPYSPRGPGLPGGSDGKVSVYNTEDPGSIPGVGRSFGEGNGNPLKYYCLENPIERGAWWAIDHGVTKSWT